MPHALTSNLLHCVFSTKDRTNSIPDPQTLGRYLGGVAREKNIPVDCRWNEQPHAPAYCPARRAAAGEGGARPEGQQVTMA